MTRRQTQALAYIARHISDHGQPPTLAEISAELGTAKGNVHRIVAALELQGHIRRWPNRPRSIQIIDPGEVRLNADVFKRVQQYAEASHVGIDAAANELIRQSLGAAG
ncbi:MAG TPA: MarR family transcriptional regulator [Verrucomicrobiae bacterium]|nr:MarR family transcriptional regulator [Verrucomicrobiae bacterium]